MTTYHKIKDEKLQYDINRQAAKISTLSSDIIDKYKYHSEEIVPSDQSRMTEPANFNYSPLGKALKKQVKAIEDQGQKQTNKCYYE